MCPNCKKTQVVLASKKFENVKCKFCGEILPPKR
jgi:ribosomal protein S27E